MLGETRGARPKHRSTVNTCVKPSTALNLGELALVPKPGASEGVPMECANSGGACTGEDRSKVSEADILIPIFIPIFASRDDDMRPCLS